MSKHIFLFVGAKPPQTLLVNPGGQLTASIGLCDYALSQGYQMEVLDTLQNSFPLPPFKTRAKKGIARIYRLLKQLSTKNVDGVIIFSANGFSFYERILMAGLCRLYRVRTMFFIRSGLFVKDVESNLINRLFVSMLLKIPNTIGVQGDSWRPFYSDLGVLPEKIMTVRNWLADESHISEEPIELKADEKMAFCFVGWLVEGKGVNELFEAIKQLAKEYDFDFYFVGAGTLQSSLQERIHQNNLNHRVNVTGWLDSAEVRLYLKKAHVFVLPSKAEGFPNAMLEAMSLGLPVICTNVGAVSDSLKNDCNGYLLENGSAESIAKAMKHYLREPELISRHSTEALKIVKQDHNRDKNCKILFNCFL